MEVAELTDLRVKAREQGVYLKVVRNTLAKRALADSQFADLDSALTGPLIYGFSIDAPGGAARLFKDFGKTNDKLKVTALSIGSGLLGPGNWTQLQLYLPATKRLQNFLQPSKHLLGNSFKQSTKFLASLCAYWRRSKTPSNWRFWHIDFFNILYPGV